MSPFFRILPFIRRHKWKLLIAAVVFLPIAGLAAFALTPSTPEYVTEVAEKGSIRQTVEAVGTVISERDLKLQFPTSGIVARVYVKEGDTVQAGQTLAQLRAGNLSADIASASARVAQAEADLRKIQEGARPEDIAVSEADVASKRASLESARVSLETSRQSLDQSRQKLDALKNEALVSLAGYVAGAGSTVTKEVTTAQNSLSVIRDILRQNDVVDAIVTSNPSTHAEIMAMADAAGARLQSVFNRASPQDYVAALALFEEAKAAVGEAQIVINRTFSLIDTLQQTSYFTESDRQTYKADLTAERSSLQTSLNTLDSSAKSLRDASANFATRIAAEEAAVSAAQGSMDKAVSDIATYEASLRIAEAQLQLKKAPTRASDISSAEAVLRQAQAALARARADYANTVLTAPIAGRITKVNVKVGEYAPLEPAVTMLGDSPYRIEMYVSEIDVPKIRLTQTGSVELDAFRGTNYALRVSEIDPAATDRDGVPKYRVRLDFVYPHDEFKIGMTGDAEIVTGIRPDVVKVPLRAVLERDDGTAYVRVMNADGTIEEQTVEIGLEGETGDVEVTGVREGDVVVVLEKS